MGSVEEVLAVHIGGFLTNDTSMFPGEVHIIDTHCTGTGILVVLHLYYCGQGKLPGAIIEVRSCLAQMEPMMTLSPFVYHILLVILSCPAH